MGTLCIGPGDLRHGVWGHEAWGTGTCTCTWAHGHMGLGRAPTQHGRRSTHELVHGWQVSIKNRFNFAPRDHAQFMGLIGLTYAVSQVHMHVATRSPLALDSLERVRRRSPPA